MVKRSIDQKFRVRNFDARNEKIATGQWLRVTGDSVVLSEDKENAIPGKQEEDSFREETSVVSGTVKISVQNCHQKPLHPLESPTQRGISASKKKNLGGRSPSGKFARQPRKDHENGICTKSPCDYWHPPVCQIYKSESGCKVGDECSLAHRQVEGQPSK